MLRSRQELLKSVFNSRLLYRYYASATTLSKPLHLFVCAADAASDSAGADLVASLKQIHRRGVHVYGVGGPLLQAQGLQSVVSDEQYQQLAAAEVVQQAHGLHKLPGFSFADKKAYLKIFRDAVWEAALHGCNTQNRTPPMLNQAKQSTTQQQQQQQQRDVLAIGQAQLPAGLAYDAVVTIGSATASQQVLFVLRKAEEQRKARLPVAVQYMVPGLWDYQQVTAAAAAWAKLTDHIMCSLPFEPEILHKAGGHASFVGHPMLQQLLQQNSFGSRKAAVVQLLQSKAVAASAAAAAHTETSTRGSSSSNSSTAEAGQQQQQQQASMPVGQLFAVGDASAFWKVFDNMHSKQHSSSSSSSSSSNLEGNQEPVACAIPTTTTSSRKRKAAVGEPQQHRQATAQQPQQQQQQQQNNRLLLCLLPGSTESEIRNSMPAFDDMSKELAQQFPNLVAAMILPDLLVEAGIQATNNFVLPVVVLPSSSTHSMNALAAAAAALSHPGPESLRATAAGVPMVCVRAGSLLREGFSSWRLGGVLPFGCTPNLVLGCQHIPEYHLWVRGAREEAVVVVARLLAENAQQPAAAPGSGSGACAQRAALQDVLLQLTPLQQQRAFPVQSISRSTGSGGQAAAAAGPLRSSVQSPSDAAASMLLQLMELRKQQEAEQLQALLAHQQA